MIKEMGNGEEHDIPEGTWEGARIFGFYVPQAVTAVFFSTKVISKFFLGILSGLRKNTTHPCKSHHYMEIPPNGDNGRGWQRVALSFPKGPQAAPAHAGFWFQQCH